MIYNLINFLNDLQVLRILLYNLLLLHYFYYAIFTMPLLCQHLMLHKYYIIFHVIHPVIFFNLSFCVTLLHNFLTMIFLIIYLLRLIRRSLIFSLTASNRGTKLPKETYNSNQTMFYNKWQHQGIA